MPAAPARLPSAGVRAALAAPGGGAGEQASPSGAGSYLSHLSPARPGSFGPVAGSSTPALSRAGSGVGSTAPPTAMSPGKRQPSGLGSGATAAAHSSSSTAGAAGGAPLGRLRGASRPASGRAAAVGGAAGGSSAAAPAASLAGLDPELQQRLEAAALQLGSREWKERLEGLAALQEALPGAQAAGAAPDAQHWLVEQLAQRAADANLKVQQQVRAGGLDGDGAVRKLRRQHAGRLPGRTLAARCSHAPPAGLRLHALPPATDAGAGCAERAAGRQERGAGVCGTRPGAPGVQVPRQRQPFSAPGELGQTSSRSTPQ